MLVSGVSKIGTGQSPASESELVWTEPGDENLHVEIAVLDASDERFVPCLKVTGTLIDPDGILRVQYIGVRFDPDEFREQREGAVRLVRPK